MEQGSFEAAGSTGADPRHPLWPDAVQTLLLDAALGQPAAALTAFERWGELVDFKTQVDGASYRLLPLVHDTLSRSGMSYPLAGYLQGIHRRSWVDVQRTLRATRLAAETLGAAGIETIVAKGVALATHYYRSPGLRPMSDCDLYVRPAQLADAVAALRAAGWQPGVPNGVARLASFRHVVNSTAFFHSELGELDLHWHVLPECRTGAFEDGWWAESVELPALAPCRRPSDTHMLFHTLAHGMRHNIFPPIRWIADAVTIVRHPATRIDWAELWRLARLTRLSPRIAEAVEYLRASYLPDLPAPPFQGSGVAEYLEARVLRVAGDPAHSAPWTNRALLTLRLLRGRGKLRVLGWAARNRASRARAWLRTR